MNVFISQDIISTVDTDGYNNLITDWQSKDPQIPICGILKLNSMNTNDPNNFNIDYEIQFSPENRVST